MLKGEKHDPLAEFVSSKGPAQEAKKMTILVPHTRKKEGGIIICGKWASPYASSCSRCPESSILAPVKWIIPRFGTYSWMAFADFTDLSAGQDTFSKQRLTLVQLISLYSLNANARMLSKNGILRHSQKTRLHHCCYMKTYSFTSSIEGKIVKIKSIISKTKLFW